MSEIQKIRELTLASNVNAEPEVFANAINFLGALKQKVKDAEQHLNACIMEWIQEHERDLVIGDDRYYISTKKTTKCKDIPVALQVIMERTGGDMQQIADHLSANAIKPGAFKMLVTQDEFEQLFEIIEKLEIRTGKPERKVMKINQRFIGNQGSEDGSEE